MRQAMRSWRGGVLAIGCLTLAAGALWLAGGCRAGEAAKTPAAALDYDGLPEGWVDLTYGDQGKKVLRTPAADCPPCTQEAGCPECAHRFHEFADTMEPDAPVTLVHVKYERDSLEVGQRYWLQGRVVPWPPFGDVVILVDTPTTTATEVELADCVANKDRFRELLEAASRSCKTDADCGIAPGGIDGGGCGTVMNREPAAELYELYNQIRPVCGLDFHCAPREVWAVCDGGRCVEKTPEYHGLPELTAPAK